MDDLSLKCAICGFDHGAVRRDRRVKDVPIAYFAWYATADSIVTDCGIVCAWSCREIWAQRCGCGYGIRDWVLDNCLGNLREMREGFYPFNGALGFLAHFIRHYRPTQDVAGKVADFALRAAQIQPRER